MNRWLSGARPFVVLGVFQVAVAMLVWSPFPGGVWHDDGVYLLLGRSLAGGEGLSYHGVAGAYPAPKFPPFYPVTLGLLWRILPDLGSVTLAAGILNLAFLVGACLLFARFLHRGMGASAWWAATLAAVGWLPLILWRNALVPFSEPLFLLAVVGALALASRLEGAPSPGADVPDAGEPGPWRWIVLVLALLAAIHVRTAGVALAGAFAAALASRGRKTAAAATLGGVAAGTLPWILWSSRANGAIPDPLRDVLGSYGSWLAHQVTAYPLGYLAGLEGQARQLLDRVLTLLLPAPVTWEPWFGDLRLLGLAFLAPAFFLGLDRIWPRSRTLVLLVFFYLIIVWLWPFSASRLLMPVAPFLVLLVASGFWWSEERSGRPAGAPPGEGEGAPPGEGPAAEGGGAVRVEGEPGADAESAAPQRIGSRPVPSWWMRAWRGVGLAWAASLGVMSLWGVAGGWAGAAYRINSGALARTVQAVEDATPPEAVVGAPEFWAAIPLHAGRTASPSARFLPVRPAEAGPSWGTPAEQHRIWALAGIDHLVLEQRGAIHGQALDAVTEACGEEAVRLIASWPEGRLVRLDWDPECRGRLAGR